MACTWPPLACVTIAFLAVAAVLAADAAVSLSADSSATATAAAAAPAAPPLPKPVSQLSAKFRGWNYLPGWAIPPAPTGPGIVNATLTDVPTLWEADSAQQQRDGLPRFRMFYLFFNGTGYQSALAVSSDLRSWDTAAVGCVFSFNPVANTFDYGGVVLGGLLLTSNNLTAPRTLAADASGRQWQLYGAYPHRNGYELRPGAQGAAFSTDGGVHWQRASVNGSVLSIYGPGTVGAWEQSCIYQPFLVNHQGTAYCFYNAANGPQEQSGIATLAVAALPGVGAGAADSKWQRFPGNPVLAAGNSSSYHAAMTSDPKTYYDAEQGVWVCFFFGGLKDGHADIMVAFATELTGPWVVDETPLYLAGGHPGGLDAQHAHKVSLVYDSDADRLIMFYTAVGSQGRGITALSSKPW